MSIHALLDLSREKQLTVTVRVKPLVEGYTVLIEAGYIGGARADVREEFRRGRSAGGGDRRDGAVAAGIL